jgi:Peptidase inhibitor I78 family
MRVPILALVGACLLAACAALDTSPPKDTHLVCQTTTLSWTLGKTADETLVRRAQLEATAKYVRVLRPGQMVTMEYVDDRLNLHVDADGKVTSYTCS